MTEDTELRLAALEHASRINNSRPTNAQTIVADAEVIYAFLKSRGITSQIPDVTISTIPHRSPSASADKWDAYEADTWRAPRLSTIGDDGGDA